MQRSSQKSEKSILILASVASMIDQFNMDNIKILLELGYRVEVACNFERGNTCSAERIDDLKRRLEEKGVRFYQVDFTRNVLNFIEDLKAYNQVKKIVKQNKYDLIHCHSPIGGVIGRIVAHEMKIKVIYTAHGFHFYDGAPLKNWLFFYPIEKFLSRWTDILITITKEDYNRAKTKFCSSQIIYSPGVGINIAKLSKHLSEKQVEEKRKSLEIPRNACVILSVGELNKNKNHASVIRAIAKMKCRENIFYIIAGKGELHNYLENLADNLNVNLLLLGYRQDIVDIYHMADIFIHPSFREGMSVATMEAVAAEKVVIASKIRGEVDLIESRCLFNPADVDEIAEKIEEAYDGKYAATIKNNRLRLQKFSAENINEEMRRLYSSIDENKLKTV